MAKKKTQFAKRNENVKKVAIICGCLAILVAAIIAVSVVFHNSRIAWVVEIDGQRIPRAEFEHFVIMVAHDMEWEVFNEIGHSIDIWQGEFDATNQAHADALEMLENTIALEMFARHHGFELSPHLLEHALANAEVYLEDYRRAFGRNNRISAERIATLQSSQFLFEEALELFGYRAEVCEEEFEEALQTELEEDRFAFVDMELSYFVAPTTLRISQFIDVLNEGMTFHEALVHFAEDDEDENGENGNNENGNDESDTENDAENGDEDDENDEPLGISLWEFHARYGIDIEDARALANLQPGERSHVITLQEGFAVIYMENITEPDVQAIRESMWEDFEMQERRQYVMDMYLEFANAIEVYRNLRAINSVNINRLLRR